MLKVKNQDVVYRVLSCIFAVILIAVMVVNRNIVDLIYLSIISMFILRYFILSACYASQEGFFSPVLKPEPEIFPIALQSGKNSNIRFELNALHCLFSFLKNIL